jgi:hypothetical protein
VQDGKQAAVLVPTTLLAQQHHQTFSDRFAGYPVRVEVLSRFLTPAQARTVAEGVRSHGGVEHDPSAQVACPGPPRHHCPWHPVPQPPPEQAPPSARSGHADHPRIPHRRYLGTGCPSADRGEWRCGIARRGSLAGAARRPYRGR